MLWRGAACSILSLPRSDCLCVNAVQEFPDSTNRAGIGRNIIGKSGNGLVKITHKVYYEVIDYTKMLQDAKKRNRIFFDKLNLVDNR